MKENLTEYQLKELKSFFESILENPNNDEKVIIDFPKWLANNAAMEIEYQYNNKNSTSKITNIKILKKVINIETNYDN